MISEVEIQIGICSDDLRLCITSQGIKAVAGVEVTVAWITYRLEIPSLIGCVTVAALRDLLVGTYGLPNDPSSFFVRAGAFLRSTDFNTKLGVCGW